LNFPKLFKTAKLALDGFKKWRALYCQLCRENCSSETKLAVLKTSQIGPGQCLKALGAAPRNLLCNQNEGFELAGI
jgi:hypothetical protein